jgi:hypothetical protein
MKIQLFFFLFFIGFFINKSNAQCSASFTYSANGGDVTVSAVGSSTGTSVYAWQWGDGTTLPGTGQTATHSYTASGTYSLCLTYIEIALPPCTTQVCEVINLNVTSLNEINAKFNNITISPNPSNGIVNIGYSINKSSKVNITLFDVTGKRLVDLENRDVLELGKHMIQYNADKLSPGLYFIRFENEYYTETKKIVIQ